MNCECLEALEGRCLFYPCAGSDWSAFLDFFGDHIDEFHFCDIAYADIEYLKSRSPFSDPSSYRLVDQKIVGPPVARIQQATEDRPYRELEPGHLRQVYKRLSDGRIFTVVRRRGFGQYALGEFQNRSIGVFVHRGDSPGESGSNIYFLANRRRRHEPLSDLFDKLTEKLADHALIISDGSNTNSGLKRRLSRRKQFSSGAFEWNHVGFIGGRRNPTPIWEVKRSGAG